MNLNLALVQREWMQHRFSWLLMLAIPLTLAALLLSFGTIQIETDAGNMPSALVLTASALAASAGLLVVLATSSGLITAIGLARRDHADRSVEFWLSLPIGHSRSLLVPMLMHLVLLPLAALAAGLAVGLVLSLILVVRTHGVAAWLALPWADVTAGALVGLARLVAGWPLVVLWLSPLIVLAMLSYAWLRRWGLVVLAVALSVGSSPLGTILGYRMVPEALTTIGAGALGALVSTPQVQLHGEPDAVLQYSIQQAPAWLVAEVAASLKNLATPAFAGGLLFAALCFYGLVQWRKRGASTAV